MCLVGSFGGWHPISMHDVQCLAFRVEARLTTFHPMPLNAYTRSPFGRNKLEFKSTEGTKSIYTW